MAAEQIGSESNIHTSSTVYVGRASFRMEHIVLPPEGVGDSDDLGQDGRSATGTRTVTAPLGLAAPMLEGSERQKQDSGISEVTQRVRLVALDDGRDEAHETGDALLPMGDLPASARVGLPRWSLAACGALAFTAGVLIAPGLMRRPHLAGRHPAAVTAPAAARVGAGSGEAKAGAATAAKNPIVLPIGPPLVPVPTVRGAASTLVPSPAAAAAPRTPEHPVARRTPTETDGRARRPRPTLVRRQPERPATAITSAPASGAWVDPFEE
jgi:hypothetical protein